MEDKGNDEEDWKIFNILCGPITDTTKITSPEAMAHEVTTALRSELAALQYKRDRLVLELQDMKSQLRSRDQRTDELHTETEQLREQAARQSAIIASLKRRIHELEEKERSLTDSLCRYEKSLELLKRENKTQFSQIQDLQKQVHKLEIECNSEEALKEAQRNAMSDLLRRLAGALGSREQTEEIVSPESLVHKASELVQETARLRNRSSTTTETLTSVEHELRSCKDALDRAVAQRDLLQRQEAAHLLELDRLKQEKDNIELQQRMSERELSELREKFALANRSLGNAHVNVASHETTISQLREELKTREDRVCRLQTDLRSLLETLAVSLSSPTRFVESQEASICQRVNELVHEHKERGQQIEALRDKSSNLSDQVTRANESQEMTTVRLRSIQDESRVVETRLHKLESELSASELSRDALRQDKETLLIFVERLGRVLNLDEISKDVGIELQTQSIMMRVQQLVALENDKLIDKTSAVYQLQRRVRTLRDQLQRRDIHLDLLRRKIALQEDNSRMKRLLETERDEANARLKKLLKQQERLQIQLSDFKEQNRELKTQLAEAAQYKIVSLERGRKVDELQKQLMDSELIRKNYTRKLNVLKDQIRSTSESADQDRSLSLHSQQILRDELSQHKQSIIEIQRREVALQSFRSTVSKLLGLDLPVTDYDIIQRLQKLVHAHRDFTLVSRRYDEPLLVTGASGSLGARTPLPLNTSPTLGSRTPYDDSGFVDRVEFSPLADSDDPPYSHGSKRGFSRPSP